MHENALLVVSGLANMIPFTVITENSELESQLWEIVGFSLNEHTRQSTPFYVVREHFSAYSNQYWNQSLPVTYEGFMVCVPFFSNLITKKNKDKNTKLTNIRGC